MVAVLNRPSGIPNGCVSQLRMILLSQQRVMQLVCCCVISFWLPCMEKQRRLRTWLVNVINSGKVSAHATTVPRVMIQSVQATLDLTRALLATCRCLLTPVSRLRMMCLLVDYRWRAWSGSMMRRTRSGSRGSTRAGTTGRRSTHRSLPLVCARTQAQTLKLNVHQYCWFWLR